MPLPHQVKRLVNRHRVLRAIYDVSKWIVNIVPFYLVEEGFVDATVPETTPNVDTKSLSVVLLDPSEAAAVSQNPEVTETERKLLGSLPDDCHCVAIRCDGTTIAYMVCNLRRCNSRYLSFPLKENEAYLACARTFTAYRGRNLAPFLRCKMYEHLNAMGRTKLYSITEYLNEAAIRFKKKLNVKPRKFCLWVCLARTCKFTVTLKTYR